MNVVCLHAKDETETFLRRNTALHLYEIGDLDDLSWPYTLWFALKDRQQIKELILLYCEAQTPVLLGFSPDQPPRHLCELVSAVAPLLPRRLGAHLTPNVANALWQDYRVHSEGTFFKMTLSQPSRIEAVDTSRAVLLSIANRGELEALYRISYPETWFSSRMLGTGYFYGLRSEGRLVSAAGVHVYSPRYRVAALGNIATHPDFRDQGLATILVAKVCQALRQTVDHIGLNVKTDNVPALACYHNLGFEGVAVFEICSLEWRSIKKRETGSALTSDQA